MVGLLLSRASFTMLSLFTIIGRSLITMGDKIAIIYYYRFPSRVPEHYSDATLPLGAPIKKRHKRAMAYSTFVAWSDLRMASKNEQPTSNI